MAATTSAQLLTVPEVAEQLRVSPYTVQNWLRTGQLKGYRPGGRKAGWRIEAEDLARFITDRKREAVLPQQ